LPEKISESTDSKEQKGREYIIVGHRFPRKPKNDRDTEPERESKRFFSGSPRLFPPLKVTLIVG
jgi:hypothetical protein